MNPIQRFCLLMFLLLVASTPARAQRYNAEKVVSLPLAEAREVVTDWLNDCGFAVFQAGGDNRRVQLEARRGGTYWSIRLQVHSALASQVDVQTVGDHEGRTVASLWIYLDEYLEKPVRAGTQYRSNVPEAVANARKAVVCIFANGPDAFFQLSGFAIEHQGLIVTTAHDLKLSQSVSVQLNDGRQLQGRVVKLDRHRDLSLVQVPDYLETVISLRNGRFMPEKNDALFACGCPRSGLDDIQAGVLDGPPRRVEGLPLWQVHLHIEPGSSGSPVVDATGRLAAVVKGRYRGTHNVGFLIPFETVMAFMQTK